MPKVKKSEKGVKQNECGIVFLILPDPIWLFLW